MLERAREGDGVDGKREEDNSSLGLGLINHRLVSVGIPEERAQLRCG